MLVKWLICLVTACKLQAWFVLSAGTPEVHEPIQLWAAVDFDKLNNLGEDQKAAAAIIAYNPNPSRQPCRGMNYHECADKQNEGVGCEVVNIKCKVSDSQKAYWESKTVTGGLKKLATWTTKCSSAGDELRATCNGGPDWMCSRKASGTFEKYPCCEIESDWRCDGEETLLVDDAKVLATLDFPQRRWHKRGFFAAQFGYLTGTPISLSTQGCFTIKRTRRGTNAVINWSTTTHSRFWSPQEFIWEGDFVGARPPQKVLDELATAGLNPATGSVRLAMPVRIQTRGETFRGIFLPDATPTSMQASVKSPHFWTGAGLSWQGNGTLDANDIALLHASPLLTEISQPFYSASRSVETCKDRYHVNVSDSAGTFTCGDRIAWLQTSQGGSLTLHAAEMQVGREFPEPHQCAACINPNIDDVWNNLATDADGTYTCGARIQWLEQIMKFNRTAAQEKIARDFLPSCGGALSGSASLLPTAPGPDIRACAVTGCCGCCFYNQAVHKGPNVDFLTLDACVQSLGPDEDPLEAILGWYPGKTCEILAPTPKPTRYPTQSPTHIPTEKPVPAPKPPPPPPVPPIRRGRCGFNKIVLFWTWTINLCPAVKMIAQALGKLGISSVAGCVGAMAGYWGLCQTAIDATCGPEVEPFALGFCSGSTAAVSDACGAVVGAGVVFDYAEIMACFDCSD